MTTTKSQKLEDQAATAALYVTQGKDKSKKSSDNYPLDKDGKLSSASAATSLKHATPRDLPSFPSVGLADTDSASGAAAHLANAHPKTVEYWKPGEIPEANRAANLAKDHKGPELWQPELSAAGSKAALLAQRDGGNVKIWRPEDSDAGQSAAGIAMRKKNLSPTAGSALSAEAGKRALTAATGAVSGNRGRSGSTPSTTANYPDAVNSSKNALKAATSVSKKPASKSDATPAPATSSQIDAARIHNQAVTNLSREMYTSNPPVAPEVEERNRQATLRAAAVSMAQRMYDVQQKQIEEAAEFEHSQSRFAANTVHRRTGSSVSSDDSHSAQPQYSNLQEAAQKLATERLAKLHDEHAAYRQYYGTQSAAPSHKLSVRGRTRNRAGSDGELDDSERAQQVRNQMSLFTDKLAQVDHKKRQTDRDLLMAAAQKNVKARMSVMDEKVFNETEKVTPAMMQDWETKAKAKAQAESESRMVNHGKVHIGAGKFLDQSEVDAIAAAKVQPTLDEISATAEKQRARDEELRQQQLERERVAAAKAADDKERANLAKDEWKRFKEQEKEEKRVKKEEERAKKAEEKRAREEKRKSKTTPVVAAVGTVAVAEEGVKAEEDVKADKDAKAEEEDAAAEAAEDKEPKTSEDAELDRYETAESGESEEVKDSLEEPAETTAVVEGSEGPPKKHDAPVSSRVAPPVTTVPATAPGTTETTISGGPSKAPKEKDSGKVSSWLKTKFSRRTSKPQKPEAAVVAAATPGSQDATTGSTAPTEATSERGGEDSMREVAVAGKDFVAPTTPATKSHAGTTTALGAHPTSETETTDPPVVSGDKAANADLYDHSDAEEGTAAGAGAAGSHEGHPHLGESTSSPEISSLSSDEDPRGRSNIRLADSMGLPHNPTTTSPTQHSAPVTLPPAVNIDEHESTLPPAVTSLTQHQQPVNKRAGMIVPDLPEGAIAAAAGVEKDDDDAEKGVDHLPPPPAAIPAVQDETGKGRVSTGSPARDSKFVEAL